MFSLTYLIGATIFLIIGRRNNIPLNKLLGLMFWSYISVFIGSRFLFILNNISQFRSNSIQFFSISPGGVAFYGGFIITIIVIGLFIKINKLSFWNILDYATPSFAIGISLTKVGCYLAGCCYGKETTLALGVQFPEYSIPALKYGFSHSIQLSVHESMHTKYVQGRMPGDVS